MIVSKENKEFRGAIIPRKYGEIDYEGMQVAQCNSMDEDTCEDIDCGKCLYDPENIELYRIWRKRRRDKISKKCPGLLD